MAKLLPPVDGHPFKRKSRAGRPTHREQSLLRQFVADQPGEVTPKQTKALADLLQRPKRTVKRLLIEAREKLTRQASRMTDVFSEATEGALKKKQFGVASDNAKWFMTNVSADGARIIDRPEAGGTGQRIQIGVQVGGIDQPSVKTITVPTSEVDE